MNAPTEGTLGNASDMHAKNPGSNRPSGRSFAEQSGRVVDEAQELGRVALHSASEAATHLREKGHDALEAGRDRAVKAKGQFDHIVAENPLKSVLIAAGVGAVLGYMLSRRSK